MDNAQLIDMLRSLSSADNTLRRASEAHFALQRSSPGAADRLPLQLLSILANAPVTDKALKLMASVLVRRVLIKGEKPLWKEASPTAREHIKSALLMTLGSEQIASLRKNLCEVITSLADEELDEFYEVAANARMDISAPWPALWSLIRSGASLSSGPIIAECAFLLLERMSFWVGSRMKGSFVQLKDLYQRAIEDVSAPMTEVRIPACRALVGLFINISSLSEATLFAPVIPSILTLLSQCAAASIDKSNGHENASKCEDSAKELSGVFISACEEQCTALKPYLGTIVQTLCSLSINRQLNYEIRGMCLESVICISEKAPVLARKLSPPADAYLNAVVPVAMQMLLEHGDVVDDSPDGNLTAWEARAGLPDGDDDDETDGEERLLDHGEETLDRVGQAIGQKKFLPVAERCIAEMLSVARASPITKDSAADPTWRLRLGAMLALNCIMGLEVDSLSRLVHAAKELAYSAVTDSHPRVRNAAFMAIGTACNLHAPLFQKETHSMIVPAIVIGLRDASNRVRISACVAISCLADQLDPESDSEVTMPYLEALLRGLIENIASGEPGRETLRLRALAALSQLTGAVGTALAPYYDMLSSGLLQLLSAPDPAPLPQQQQQQMQGGDARALRQLTASSLHARTLKGKSLECLSCLGVAVGIEKFRQHAVPALNGIVGILTQSGASQAGAAADDPVQSYCWDAVGRFAKLLGADDFAPYVPILAPPLLVAASQVGFIKILDESDNDDGEDELASDSDSVSIRRGRNGGDDDNEEADDGVEEERTSDGKITQVKTSELEDKQSATDALVNLFHTFPTAPSLVPFSTPFLELILSTLTSPGLRAFIFQDLRQSMLVAIEDIFLSLASTLTVQEVESGYASLLSSSTGAQAMPTPPSSAPTQYLTMLNTTVSVLDKHLTEAKGGSSTSNEEEEGDDGGSYVGVTILAIKNTIENACGRMSFRGEAVPGSVAAAAIAPRDRFLPLLPSSLLESLCSSLLQVRQEAVQRRAVRAAERQIAGEVDEEEEERIEDREARDKDIMIGVIDLLGVLFKTHGSKFAPAFTKLASGTVESWAHAECLPFDRMNLLLLLDDVIEYSGDAIMDSGNGSASPPQTLAERYLPHLIQETRGKDQAARQASLFGLGAAAAGCGREAVSKSLPQVISALVDAINSTPKAKSDEATDNAVSSLFKVIAAVLPTPESTKTYAVDRTSLISLGLSRLPLDKDIAENAHVVNRLCALLNSRDADLLSSKLGGEDIDVGKVAACINAIGFACNEEKVSSVGQPSVLLMRQTAASTLRALQTWMPPAILGSVWSTLSTEVRDTVSSLMQTQT